MVKVISSVVVDFEKYVHVLLADVSNDVRNVHWHVNNKIKRKFTLFSVNTIKNFISCNENTPIFTRASHCEKVILQNSASIKGLNSRLSWALANTDKALKL